MSVLLCAKKHAFLSTLEDKLLRHFDKTTRSFDHAYIVYCGQESIRVQQNKSHILFIRDITQPRPGNIKS